uniref:peptidyl-tRNA hydrolase n=1 Tax=Caenorhabditis tropicalis TaxID=1561998 RepID=A0A1I7T1B2_9PELO
MSENIPDIDPNEQLPNNPGQPQDLGIDNPPEPDNASIRAERGSPTPSSVTVDNAPSLPNRSFSSLPINDPFSNDIPEVPIPSSALSFSSQALSDPVPTPSDTSRPGVVQNDEKTSNVNHPVDPQEPNEVNHEYLAHLLDLGFDDYTATLSLQRTNNVGVEQAVAWIVERSNESDFDDGSSSSENEAEEGMGAVQSTAGRTHKMVLVANMSLKMGTGKLAAQVGHATLGVYRQAMNSEAGQNAVAAWTRHGQVKIVVKGQSTEQLMDLCKAAKDAGCFYYLVMDAGYTQIPPGSRTVLGIFGTVEQVDSVTGGLKLL